MLKTSNLVLKPRQGWEGGEGGWVWMFSPHPPPPFSRKNKASLKGKSSQPPHFKSLVNPPPAVRFMVITHVTQVHFVVLT